MPAHNLRYESKNCRPDLHRKYLGKVFSFWSGVFRRSCTPLHFPPKKQRSSNNQSIWLSWPVFGKLLSAKNTKFVVISQTPDKILIPRIHFLLPVSW
jgi:hypothetical protein